MKRLLAILVIMTGVVLLACSTCLAQEIFFKGGKPAGISFFSDGFRWVGSNLRQIIAFFGPSLWHIPPGGKRSIRSEEDFSDRYR